MPDNARQLSTITLKEILQELATLTGNISRLETILSAHSEDLEQLRKEYYGPQSIQTKTEVMKLSLKNIEENTIKEFKNLENKLDKEIEYREKTQSESRTRNWQIILVIITGIVSLCVSLLTLMLTLGFRK